MWKYNERQVRGTSMRSVCRYWPALRPRWVWPLLALPLLLRPGDASAQEEGGEADQESTAGEVEEEFELLAEEEQVVTAAARHQQTLMESPSAITVITREQIEHSPCRSMACLLRGVPEIDVRQISAMYVSVGGRALTGEAGDRVLLLIDGREANIETVGPPGFEILPIHLDDIERIEVIRGPGSALYGANAHSAVVAVTTRAPAERRPSVLLGVGERGHQTFHARVEKNLGETRLSLAAGGDFADSFQVRSRQDKNVKRVNLRLDRDFSPGSLSLTAGGSFFDGQVHLGLSPGRFRDGMDAYLLGAFRAESWDARLWFNVSRCNIDPDMPLVFGDLRIGGFTHPYRFVSTRLDGEAEKRFEPFAGNMLIVGGNYRWITFLSDDNDPATTHQHRAGLFVHDEQRLGESLRLTAGIRFDYNNITRGDLFGADFPLAVSPRLAGVWRFAADQNLRLAFGKAFRKPSFFNTSLHMTNVQGEPGFEGIGDFFRQNVGNDNLGNESITTLELGYLGRFFGGALTLEAGVFYNRYRDTINYYLDIRTRTVAGIQVPDLQNSRMEWRNAGRDVDSLGGSLSATLYVRDRLRLHANAIYRYSYYVSEIGPDAGPAEGEKGSRVQWEPAIRYHFSSAFQPWEGLWTGLAMHGASSTTDARPPGGSILVPRVIVSEKPYTYFDLFFEQSFTLAGRRTQAGIQIENVFDQPFYDVASLPLEDGRVMGGELIGRTVFAYLRQSF